MTKAEKVAFAFLAVMMLIFWSRDANFPALLH